MTDYTKILQSAAFEAKAPALAPEGQYPGQILNWKMDQSRGATPKPIIKILMQAEDWPETVAEADRKGDITKKRFERDYFIDPSEPDSMYYIDQLLRSCGISGGSGQTYEELLPQLQGAKVLITVKRRSYEDKKTHEMREALDIPNIVGR